MLCCRIKGDRETTFISLEDGEKFRPYGQETINGQRQHGHKTTSQGWTVILTPFFSGGFPASRFLFYG